jgi:hypothetical protein
MTTEDTSVKRDDVKLHQKKLDALKDAIAAVGDYSVVTQLAQGLKDDEITKLKEEIKNLKIEQQKALDLLEAKLAELVPESRSTTKTKGTYKRFSTSLDTIISEIKKAGKEGIKTPKLAKILGTDNTRLGIFLNKKENAEMLKDVRFDKKGTTKIWFHKKA